MCKLENRPYLAYLSYPFSRNPIKFGEEACSIARKIMIKHPNVFVIVPHTAVDVTVFGPLKEKITDYNNKDHTLSSQLEFTILSKIDIFIQGVPDDPSVSMGCIWEHSFVCWLNRVRKRQILLTTPEKILNGKDN